MAMEFRHTRIKAIPLVVDPDPNVTPPAAADVFLMSDQPPGSDLETDAHLIAPVFNAEEAATATFVVWVRDAKTLKWLKASTNAVQPHRTPVRNVGFGSGDVFVQVTAVAVIAATSLSILGAEGA